MSWFNSGIFVTVGKMVTLPQFCHQSLISKKWGIGHESEMKSKLK